MGRLIFDEPAWWQRPRWQIATGVVAATGAVAVWSLALAPAQPRPTTPQAPNAAPMAMRPTPSPIAPITPITPAAASAAVAAAPTPPPRSTMVAPGVHITPLSVPPGTEPMPAGPSERDSEPEN